MKKQSFYLGLFSKIIHENTKDYLINSTSSFSDERILFSDHHDVIDVSSIEKDLFSSSKCEKSFTFSDTNCLVALRNAKGEEEQKDILVARLAKQLEDALKLYDDEEGKGLSSAEKKIIEIEKKYKMRILGEVIQIVYVHHFHNSSYLVGICNSLLRYDLDEVQPWGATMLTGFLNHSDERVQEATIQLIDNWSDIDLLPILKTLLISSKWMQDYVNDVVKSLEKENVLYQKIV